MKKVILLLPDTMTYVRGSRTSKLSAPKDTNEENVTKALTINDYHMNYFYENAQEVKVLEISDVHP